MNFKRRSDGRIAMVLAAVALLVFALTHISRTPSTSPQSPEVLLPDPHAPPGTRTHAPPLPSAPPTAVTSSSSTSSPNQRTEAAPRPMGATAAVFSALVLAGAGSLSTFSLLLLLSPSDSGTGSGPAAALAQRARKHSAVTRLEALLRKLVGSALFDCVSVAFAWTSAFYVLHALLFVALSHAVHRVAPLTPPLRLLLHVCVGCVWIRSSEVLTSLRAALRRR
jgi:hypothetical protein